MDVLKELELRQASDLLAAARRDQEDALREQRARIEKARADSKAIEEAKIAKKKLDDEEMQAMWREKKLREEETERQNLRKKQQEDQYLAARLAEVEKEEVEKRKHDVEVKRLLEEAMILHDKAAQLRRESVEATTVQETVQTLANIPVLDRLRFPNQLENEDRSVEEQVEAKRVEEAEQREAARKVALAKSQEEQRVLESYAVENPMETLNE